MKYLIKWKRCKNVTLIIFLFTYILGSKVLPTEATELGGGIVKTLTDVKSQADIALDLRDIASLLDHYNMNETDSNNDFIEEAKLIYFGGKHSVIDNESIPRKMRSLHYMTGDQGEFDALKMKEPTFLVRPRYTFCR